MSGEDVVRHKLAQRAQRFAELSELLADPEVAGQPRKFQEYLREHGRLEASAQLQRTAEELGRRRAQAEELLADGSVDRELRELAREELAQLTPAEAELSQAIVAELVRDEDLERRKLIVELRAGTGGDEATLFVRDLYEMYGRYIDSRGWRREAIDAASSDVGGFKEVVFAVEGEGAWNCLRFESGGHRVQRVPATESQGRIHTSLATVAVLPEAEAVELELRDEDLRIDTMRAGGPGGQSVNTTSSAVRITHLPTGTVVQCQDEKSQLKNKAKALRVLRARLFDAEQRRRDEERAEARRGLVGSGDRSQRIRTYNFPQARVSDHRLEGNHSLEPILAGRLQPLLDQLLDLDRAERIRQL